MTTSTLPSGPLNATDREKLLQLVSRRARTDLCDYAEICDRKWKPSQAHRFIARVLQDAIEGKRRRRLILTTPPRLGKSRLASVELPTWFLGHNPAKHVVLASYSANLSKERSVEARHRTLEPIYHRIFPGMRSRGIKASSEFWGTNKWGSFKAVGVGGSLTGRGADCLIVDDPFSNYEEAHSQTIRDNVWNWFLSVAMTRLSPDATVIIIMCMTGETPVLMADGTERPLRDIRPGDRVATYDRGKLKESVVRNHASQGHDNIFRITMASGRVVHANERHPFLVEEQGERRWIRVKNLSTDHRIVTLKDSGESGRELSAQWQDAASRSAAVDFARGITPSRSGPTDIALRALIQKESESVTSSIVTGSPQPSSTPDCWPREASAPYANNHPEPTLEHTGEGNFASITITTQEPYVDCSATTATSPLHMPSRQLLRSQWSSTSEFTTEAILSIEPAGVAEVFDVQIDGTENYIANGLVSHNTRWHVDDTVGRLMDPSFQKLLGDGPESEKFERINLAALAETDDPLGREPGESAYPEKFTAERYKAIQSLLGSYLFSALYQGNPVRKGGNYCNVDDFVICDREEVPADLRWSRFWDLATSEDTMADFTASPAGAMGPPPGWKPKPLPSGGFEEMPKTHFYIRDMIRGQWEWPKSRERIRATAELERIEVGIEAVAGFKTAFQNVREVLPGHIPLREIGVSKDKLTRALGWMAMVEAKKVILVRGDWINEFKSEVEAFPAGKHDDMVDGVSGVYGMVAQPILFGLL